MSLLDEVSAKLGAMSTEDKAALIQQIAPLKEKMRFVPLPGPQTDAYLSKADVLLYGGQAGGGKSFLLMGLSSQEHTRSIIFRRESSQTDGLEEAGKSIIGASANYNGTDKEWKWPEGRSVKLAGMQLPDDWNKHAGRERDLMCVGAGTPVLMADGGYKPIETLSVGEMVATMEGPRRIVRTLPVQRKPSVVISVRGDAGIVVRQVQSATHSVLTDTGWFSSDALSGVYQSTLGHEGGSTSRLSSLRYANLSNSLSRIWTGLSHMGGCAQAWICALPGLVGRAASLQPSGGSGSSGCYGHNQAAFQLPSVFAQPRRRRHFLPLTAPSVGSRAPSHVLSRGRALSAPSSSLDHCSGGSHQHGEPLPQDPSWGIGRGGGQQGTLLLADVGQPSPSHSLANGLGRTQTRSRSPRSYAHPYTKEIRQVARSCSLRCAAFDITPIGDCDVYDLQIEEVNHYITLGGIVNQNCFDEAGEFQREQVASLFGWNRGPDGQRCRIILASNPPRSSDGYWLTEWFAPWLDLQWPNPAEHGELRYAHLIDGSPMWVDGPDDLSSTGDKPLSFTFIPAKLSDNPYRDTAEYRSKLESLPEPLRSQLKFGDFAAGTIDGVNQAIPTDWVKQAQARWEPVRPVGVPMCAIGVDVAQGGTDQTVLAIRFDGWYAPLEAIPGVETPSGAEVAGKVLARRHDNAKVIVDLGGGWGGDALAHLTGNQVDAVGYMGVKDSVRRTRDNQLKFSNVRTEAYWRFREALDPYTQEGSPIRLPNDRELLADLTAPTYETKSGKGGMIIHLEPKDKLVKRLGRSPDKGDAVVMAWWAGQKAVTDMAEWRQAPRSFNRTPVVIMKRKR